MKIGNTTCFWLHLDCNPGPPYSAFHQMYEPCNSPRCSCSGNNCVVATLRTSAPSEIPYPKMEKLKHFSNDTIETAFDVGSETDRRKLKYGGEHREYVVNDGTKNHLVQMIRVSAKVKNGPSENIDWDFWVAFEVNGDPPADPGKADITGTKVGETIVLSKTTLNEPKYKVDVKEDLVVILQGFLP